MTATPPFAFNRSNAALDRHRSERILAATTIDLHTLAIVLALGNLLQVIALFAQYRLNRTYVGLGWWTAGTAAVALGFAAAFLQDHPTLGSLATVAATAMFASGMALYYVGLRRFLGRRERHWRLVVFCTSATLVATYFTYLDANVAARLVTLAVAMAALSFLSAHTLIAHRTHSLATSAYSLALVFLAQGVLLIAIALLAAFSEHEGLFAATPAHTMLYLDGLAVSILLTLYFIIIVNQRLNAENREAKENVERMFNVNPDPIMIVRLVDGRCVAVNDRFAEHSGYTGAEAIGKTTLEIDFWKDPADRETVFDALGQHGRCDNLEVVLRRKDGSEFIGLLSATIIRLKAIPCMIAVIRDITDRKREEEKNRRSHELLSLFIRHSPIYTYIKEVTPTETRVLHASDNFERILGISAQDMVGKTMSDLFPPEVAAPMTADDRRVVTEGAVLKRDETFNGRGYASIKFPILQGDKTLLAGYSIDTTERMCLEKRLQYQADTDDLTGVTNRRRFLELAHTETNRALRYRHPLALALIDIDRFKRINDLYGHAAGDRALLVVVQVCRRSIRDSDVFARYGGDEFAVLLPETGRDEAAEVMQRLCLSAAAQPVDLGDGPMAITISAGIATLASKDSLDALLARADHALYQAKKTGRNRVAMTETGV